MTIKNYKPGDQIEETLLVISATPRKTKTQKDYLQMVFTDGTDQIPANYWDWVSGKVPPPNAIMNVKAQVTEWQGKPQLTVNSLAANTTATVEDFVATGPHDVHGLFKAALNLADQITDPILKICTTQAFQNLEKLWCSIPGAVTVHHAYKGGTLAHCLSVGCLAAAMAEQIYGVNRDVCIAAGLLHDIGKLFTYKWNGATIELTDEGKLYDHTFLGARFISNFVEEIDLIALRSELGVVSPSSFKDENNSGCVVQIGSSFMHEGVFQNSDILEYLPVKMLVHCILSHHGTLENGAAVPPLSAEAAIVHHADSLDAFIEILANNGDENNVWTDRIYFLGNKPHLSIQHTSQYIISEESQDDTEDESE